MADPKPPTRDSAHWRSTVIYGCLWLAFFACIGIGMWRLIRPPEFVATAQLLVIKGPGMRDNKEAHKSSDDFVATNMALLRSPIILAQAVKKRELNQLKTFEEAGDIVSAVQKMLTVEHDHDPRGLPQNIINIRCRGPIAEDCTKILSAVIESFHDFIDVTDHNLNDRLLENLTKAREKLDKDLKAAEKWLVDLREAAARDGLKKSNVIESQIVGLEQKALDLKLRREEIKRRLAAAEASPESLRVKLHAREWAIKSGYDSLPAADRKAKSEIAAYVDHLNDRLGEFDADEKILGKLLEDQSGLLRKAQTFDTQEEHIRYQIGQYQRLYETMVKKLAEIDLVRDGSGPDFRVLAPPKVVRR